VTTKFYFRDHARTLILDLLGVKEVFWDVFAVKEFQKEPNQPSLRTNRDMGNNLDSGDG